MTDGVDSCPGSLHILSPNVLDSQGRGNPDLKAHAHRDSVNTVIIDTVENYMQRERKRAWVSLQKIFKSNTN